MVRRLKRGRKRRGPGQKGGFLNALLSDLRRIPKADRQAIPRDLKRMAKAIMPPKGKEGLVPFSPRLFGGFRNQVGGFTPLHLIAYLIKKSKKT